MVTISSLKQKYSRGRAVAYFRSLSLILLENIGNSIAWKEVYE